MLRSSIVLFCCLTGCTQAAKRSIEPDTDRDGVVDEVDNCPNTSNTGQADFDEDDIGDVCDSDDDNDGAPDTTDNCPRLKSSSQVDQDQDQVGDACDNCPANANPDQANTDNDAYGDACDTDTDGDGVNNYNTNGTTPLDNCPVSPNGVGQVNTPGVGNQINSDTDGLGDACDNCDRVSNLDQLNSDSSCVSGVCTRDDLGDACDTDIDGDGSHDKLGDFRQCTEGTQGCDNCVLVPNGSTQTNISGVGNQTNSDSDASGDACDLNDDNDGTNDYLADGTTPLDNCRTVSNSSQNDFDTDGTGDVCDDHDSDAVMDDTDNCRLIPNGVGQANAPGVGNQTDSDGDSLGNACDPDDDNDNINDYQSDGTTALDNCPLTPNGQSQVSILGVGNQINSDTDGLGNACDNCPVIDNQNQLRTAQIADITRTELPALNLGDACAIKKISAGQLHNCVLLYNGKVKCWGGNGSGQLGLKDVTPRGTAASQMGASLPFVAVGPAVKDIATGLRHTCVVYADNKIKCWGENDSGALGQITPEQNGSSVNNFNYGDDSDDEISALGFLEFRNTPDSQEISSIAAGFDGACVSVRDKRTTHSNYVTCWGRGDKGVMGRDSADDILTPNTGALGNISVAVTSVHMAGRFACAVGPDNIWCWGENASGALGLNSSTNQYSPWALAVTITAPSRVVTSVFLTDHTLSDDSTCAIYDSGKLTCWGMNSHGQLGRNSTTSIGNTSSGANAMSLSPVVFETDGTTAVVDVSLGLRHTCAIYDHTVSVGTKRKLKCWGGNFHKQAGANDSCACCDYCSDYFGGGNYAVSAAPALQLSSNTAISAIAVAAGAFHTCVLRSDNNVKCWGRNEVGQLGMGITTTPVAHVFTNQVVNLGLRPWPTPPSSVPN